MEKGQEKFKEWNQKRKDEIRTINQLNEKLSFQIYSESF